MGRTQMGKNGLVLGVASAALLASGCREERIRNAYSAEFRCDTAIDVDELGMERYRVTGCGRSVVYQCIQEACVPDREEKVAASGSATRVSEPVSESATGAHRVTKDGKTFVALDLKLDDKTTLNLRAVPDDQEKGALLKIVRVEATASVEHCPLLSLVNGKRIEYPDSEFVRSESDGITSVKATLSRDAIGELGLVEQFAFRACDRRWPLSAAQIGELHRFGKLYDEDTAWNGGPKKPTSDLETPSGGWAKWELDEARTPLPAKGAPVLDGKDLFRTLAPSVFRVEAKLKDGYAQGSAVAVSKSELVTNCHVIAGALQIHLKQQKSEWVAAQVRSDPATDRCVLTVAGALFTPVAGFRAYDDLEIGEPLYTLGTPSGLDLTLSNGILSGLRKEADNRYVQTTAPISPGSSGGGLFDSHGYLVGVTTLVLVGREHLNQSLNFAIPAEIFFRR